MSFEWDARKSRSNERKHVIPLDIVPLIFEGPLLAQRSDRHGEARWLAIGLLEGVAIVCAYTKHRGNIRIISARRANRHERERYEAVAHAGGR